jgi:hypothetical protein
MALIKACKPDRTLNSLPDIGHNRRAVPGDSHRPVQYLNNIQEQDHRARVPRSSANDRRIRGHADDPQGAGALVSAADVRQQNQFIDKLFDGGLRPRCLVPLDASSVLVFKVATLPT